MPLRTEVPTNTAPVRAEGGASAATRASVSLFFGRTELTADAHSKSTGDRRKVQIDWNAAATLRAPRARRMPSSR